MSISRIIGNNINLEIKNKSIELADFADELGFTKADIHKLIEGRLFVPPFQLNKIADVLGISRKELLEDKGSLIYNSLVHNFRDFTCDENKELVLDLIDMYADLSEVL